MSDVTQVSMNFTQRELRLLDEVRGTQSRKEFCKNHLVDYLYGITENQTQPNVDTPKLTLNLTSEIQNTHEQLRDLFMRERPSTLRKLNEERAPFTCVRGDEHGEDHVIEANELFSWIGVGRKSLGDEWKKNLPVCRTCTEVLKIQWDEGNQFI